MLNIFENCSSLVNISFGDSLLKIVGNVFEGTPWYKRQSFGLVYAGPVALIYKGDMPENTEITIKEGCLGIAACAFEGCDNLSTITIPSTVTNVGEKAFTCRGLRKVFCRAKLPPILDGTVFYSSSQSKCELYVPKGCFEIYATTEGWRDFAVIQEEDEATVIQPISRKYDDTPYFNLNGQRVAKPIKGMYIVDGKKVMK